MDTVPLVIDPTSGAVLLDADDLSLGYRGGLRFAAARDIGYRDDIEFEFFYVDPLSFSTTVATPGAQMLVYGATFGTDPFNVRYNTDLYNFEINWRRAWGAGCVKTLIGFRMIELSEALTVTDAISPPQLFVGDIDNHLYGFQLGLEATILRRGRWEIDGGLKCGIYGNSADFDAAFPQAGPAAVFHASEDFHTDATFAGDLWLGVNYQLTDCLALRLGYQAMWIEGVAVLPEQLDDLAVPILGELDMGGSPFYHGAYFGAQLDW